MATPAFSLTPSLAPAATVHEEATSPPSTVTVHDVVLLAFS